MIVNRILDFLKGHKNKIILYLIIFLLLLSVIYFAASGDGVALKGLVFLLSVLTYIGIFFGMRFAIFLRRELICTLRRLLGETGHSQDDPSPSSPSKSGMVLSVAVLIFTASQVILCTFDFVTTVGGFSLVMCSCCYAMFSVFAYLL